MALDPLAKAARAQARAIERQKAKDKLRDALKETSVKLVTVQPRIYKAGRTTAGFQRTKPLTSVVGVEVGTTLIWVSHQFQSENLVIVIRPPDDFVEIDGDIRVYCKYCNLRGEPFGTSCMAIADKWLHEPDGVHDEFWFTEKAEDPYDKVEQYRNVTAGELLEGYYVEKPA